MESVFDKGLADTLFACSDSVDMTTATPLCVSGLFGCGVQVLRRMVESYGGILKFDITPF